MDKKKILLSNFWNVQIIVLFPFSNGFYSTYYSSEQPAGRWHKHPAGFHHSRDTSGHNRAPSRAATAVRASGYQMESVFVRNNLQLLTKTVWLYVHGLPFLSRCTSPLFVSFLSCNINDLSVKTSSRCEQTPFGAAKLKSFTPFDDISNELTGSLCLFTGWARPEPRGTQRR